MISELTDLRNKTVSALFPSLPFPPYPIHVDRVLQDILLQTTDPPFPSSCHGLGLGFGLGLGLGLGLRLRG